MLIQFQVKHKARRALILITPDYIGGLQKIYDINPKGVECDY
jgi:hypothetical protein